MASDVLGSVLPRAQGYGGALPADRRISVDGSDVVKIREAAEYCVGAARRGLGPSVIECLTFRHGGHNIGQNLPDNELSDADRAVRRTDPLFVLRTRLATTLGSEGAASAAIDAIDKQVAEEIDAAEAFALASPEPNLADLDHAVFAPAAAATASTAVTAASAATSAATATAATEEPEERLLSFSEAIAEAHHLALSSDPRVVVMGEDIAELGGIFQCTSGLWKEFGPQRVIETPISEACIGAAAVGAAATGKVVPIVEVQIMDGARRRSSPWRAPCLLRPLLTPHVRSPVRALQSSL